jgi:chromatin remodeling complex protein RSC6
MATAAKKKKPSAFDKPVNITDELAVIVGKGPMKRTEITKKLWAYIKKKDLQNPQNRREIILDAELKAVMGPRKQKVDMFEMTRLVNKHIN